MLRYIDVCDCVRACVRVCVRVCLVCVCVCVCGRVQSVHYLPVPQRESAKALESSAFLLPVRERRCSLSAR